jgi:ABC-2 type transport system ATP-binding protein
MEIELHFEDLTVEYDHHAALRSVTGIARGRVIAVLGHNGAGKSTLLKTILKLLEPSSGRIEVRQEGTVLFPEKDMAFCPETGAVFADISVEEYIKLWCRLRHRDSRYYKKAGKYFMDLLEVEPLLQKFGRELSKGQRRRVQTAIGFLLSPKLFLFDEPFDGLDIQRTEELSRIIHANEKDTNFIVSSHRMDVMERLADYFVVLQEGRLIASGLRDETTQALAGSSAFLRTRQAREVTKALTELFPHLLIGQVGGHVQITGKGWSKTELIGSLEQIGRIDHFEETIPTLVDAMSYHLRATRN